MLSSFPACLPPFITFIIGIGIAYCSSIPATCSQIYTQRGVFVDFAAALQTAIEAPRTEFAPNFVLFWVPSSSISRSSISLCSRTSIPSNSFLITVLTASTALRTPLPPYRLLSPSLFSHASLVPVDAPEGTHALPNPVSVCTSTSTVGFPRESKISLPFISLIIVVAVIFLFDLI